MKWFLFVILLNVDNTSKVLQDEVSYSTMVECFEARELEVKVRGRPIKNYQVVCVEKDFTQYIKSDLIRK